MELIPFFLNLSLVEKFSLKIDHKNKSKNSSNSDFPTFSSQKFPAQDSKLPTQDSG